MNSIFVRILGFALIVAAIIGLLFSTLGIYGIWIIKDTLTENLLSTVMLTQTALEATSDGLIVAEASLTRATVNIISLRNTLQSTSRAIRSTRPLFTSLSNLLEEDLPDTIQATRTSLATARSSARVIENFLKIISSIPFLPIQPYNPPVPLHESLADVSESLKGLPETFTKMDNSLSKSQDNLTLIEAEFNIMARHVEQINVSLSEANNVIIQYQAVVSTLQDGITNLETKIHKWVNYSTWFLTFALIWLIVTQLGLLAQGIQLIKTNRGVERVEKLVEEKMADTEEIVDKGSPAGENRSEDDQDKQ